MNSDTQQNMETIYEAFIRHLLPLAYEIRLYGLSVVIAYANLYEEKEP